jgi:DNA-binding response OmpR family regulator
MDLAMPRMNGLEATRRFRALDPRPVVVILTVHDEEVYRRTAAAAGAAAFLEKKLLGTDLWPTLLRLLELPGKEGFLGKAGEAEGPLRDSRAASPNVGVDKEGPV